MLELSMKPKELKKQKLKKREEQSYPENQPKIRGVRPSVCLSVLYRQKLLKNRNISNLICGDGQTSIERQAS